MGIVGGKKVRDRWTTPTPTNHDQSTLHVTTSEPYHSTTHLLQRRPFLDDATPFLLAQRSLVIAKDETYSAADIYQAANAWWAVIADINFNHNSSEAQAECLYSYASVMLNLSKGQDDMDGTIIMLREALSTLPYTPSQPRYNIV
ncbi:4068_t:CDS:2, partial [Acaulospora colombiana]